MLEKLNIGILCIPSSNRSELRETTRLKQEIEDAGHSPVVINYRRTAVGVTEEGRAVYEYDKSGSLFTRVDVDAVIPRIGKFTDIGLTALKAFEMSGTPSTASSESIRLAKDKIQTQLLLDKAGINTPYGLMILGLIPEKTTTLLKMVQPNSRGPIVIKTAYGSHGKGVVKADSLSSAKSMLDSFNEGPIILQEFIEPSHEDVHDDVRMIVIGGQVVASMRRFVEIKDEDTDFRANLSLGGSAILYEPTPREEEMAVRSAETLGLDIAGVDIMHSIRGPLVTEVNDNLEFGIEKVTGTNVASLMVRIAIEKALLSKNNMPMSPSVLMTDN